MQGYAPLDQYLMGFRAPEEVPPTFLVEGASVFLTLPRSGVSFNGVRRDVTVSDIIEAEGKRHPDHTVSQRKFRFGFVLIARADDREYSLQLAQIEAYRDEFERYYSKAASERASAETAQKRSVRVSIFPAAGVRVGASAKGSISIAAPAESALTFLLRPQNGSVDVPGSVVIPAGATTALFDIAGKRRDVEEISIEP